MPRQLVKVGDGHPPPFCTSCPDLHSKAMGILHSKLLLLTPPPRFNPTMSVFEGEINAKRALSATSLNPNIDR